MKASSCAWSTCIEGRARCSSGLLSRAHDRSRCTPPWTPRYVEERMRPMAEIQAPGSAAQMPEDVSPAAVPDVAAETPRFGPLQLPSAPFWVALIGGIVAVLVLVAA